jgi:hypothetical protein
MGRVTKRFVATSADREAHGLAIIDTGADKTVLSTRVAERMGVRPGWNDIGNHFGIGDQEFLHWKYRVRLSIGSYSTELTVTTPFAAIVEDDEGNKDAEPIVQSENLIGHDFLQEVKVPLNYARPHSKIFGGKRRRIRIGYMREGIMTPELLALARACEAKYFVGRKDWDKVKPKRSRTKRGGKRRG